MSSKDYKKLTLEKAKSMLFVTTVAMRSGWGVIPAGTKVRVTQKMQGWSVITEPCGCCGLQATMRRVHPGYLEVLQ